MERQKLLDEIADTYRVFDFWRDKRHCSGRELEDKFLELANQILTLIQKETYLKAERGLPKDLHWHDYHAHCAYLAAQQDMLQPDTEGRVWRVVYDSWE